MIAMGRLNSFIARLLSCKQKTFSITYLGILMKPTQLNRMDWTPLLDSIQRKLEGWRGRMLSLGGRIILLNAILSATPLYYMSFVFITVVRRMINRIRGRLIWAGSYDTS